MTHYFDIVDRTESLFCKASNQAAAIKRTCEEWTQETEDSLIMRYEMLIRGRNIQTYDRTAMSTLKKFGLAESTDEDLKSMVLNVPRMEVQTPVEEAL